MSKEVYTERSQDFEAFVCNQERMFQRQLGNLANMVMTNLEGQAARPTPPEEPTRRPEEDQPHIIIGEYEVIRSKPDRRDLWQKFIRTVGVGWNLGRCNLYPVIAALLATASLYSLKPWLAIVFCCLAMIWLLRQRSRRQGRWAR